MPLIFNTSQQSQAVPNEHNLTSGPSSSVESSESLNEQSSRPSTSDSIQTVPAATTSLAASACDIHQNIQSATSASTSNASNISLPYTTGINPHVY